MGGGRHKNRGYNLNPAQFGPGQRKEWAEGILEQFRGSSVDFSVAVRAGRTELGCHETQLHGVTLP